MNNDQRLSRLLDSLGTTEPAPIRKREFFLIALCLALAGLYVSGQDFADEQYLMQERAKAEAKKAALFAAVISHCLNGGAIKVGDSDVVSCERRAEKRGRR